MRVRSFFVAAVCFVSPLALATPSVEAVKPPGQDAPTLDYAAAEIRAALPEAVEDAEDLRVYVGTADRLEGWPFGLEEPAGDGYLLHAEGDALYVGGLTPKGALNGAYALLEELGYGFYLSETAAPAEPVRASALEDLHASRTPAAAVRGLAPWPGYLDSRLTWDLEDYLHYLRQMARMRFNLLTFYVPDDEPWAAYEQDGEFTAGEPLKNTSQDLRGAGPMRVDAFFAGTAQYFAYEHFGAASSFIAERDASIRAAKETLREALAHADALGIDACIGFECAGDPTEPETQARFEARLKALLNYYPGIDYVAIWQPEELSAAPAPPPPYRSQLAAHARRWSAAFAEAGGAAKQAEGVRLALFAKMAQQVASAVQPEVRLVVSGWASPTGGFEDLLPGLDELVADSAVFAPLETGGGIRSELSAGRAIWPIIRLEREGAPWGAFADLGAVAAACAEARAAGHAGLTGMHGGLRSADLPAAYLARAAWAPGLTVDAFLADHAREVYGPEAGDEMAVILEALYENASETGRVRPGGFAWAPGSPEARTAIAEAANETQSLMDAGGFALPMVPGEVMQLQRDLLDIGKQLGEEVGLGAGLDFADNALNRLRPQAEMTRADRALSDFYLRLVFLLTWDRAAFMLGGDSLLDRLALDESGEEALDYVRQSGLAEAMYLYAGRMRTKQELGALAAMNVLAWGDVRSRLALADDRLATLQERPADIEAQPALHRLPGRIIAAGAGEVEGAALRLAADNDATALDRYGRTTFSLAPLWKLSAGQSPTAVEYGVVVETGDGAGELRWPPPFPTERATHVAWEPSMAQLEAPAPPRGQPGLAPGTLTVHPRPEQYVVELSWNAGPGARYDVLRDGERLGTAYWGWFLDAAPPSGKNVTYRVVARDLAGAATEEARRAALLPEFTQPQPPTELELTTRGGRAVVGWRHDAGNAAAYSVTRYNEDTGEEASFEVPAYYGHYLEVSEPFEPGSAYSYDVAAVAPDGTLSEPSTPTGIVATASSFTPRVRLSFSDDRFLTGLAQIAENNLALGGGGWTDLPPQPAWDPADELTLALWVKLDTAYGTPVLVCKGAWTQPAYYAQLRQGRLRFHLSGIGALDAGRVEAGPWQHIVAAYGHGEMRTYVNGRLAGIQSAGEAHINRDGEDAGVFVLNGLMDDIRIYDAALTSEEVRALFEEGAPTGL